MDFYFCQDPSHDLAEHYDPCYWRALINLMILTWKTALLQREEKIINSSKCTSRKYWVKNYFSLCVCQNNFFHACQTRSPSIPVSCIKTSHTHSQMLCCYRAGGWLMKRHLEQMQTGIYRCRLQSWKNL